MPKRMINRVKSICLYSLGPLLLLLFCVLALTGCRDGADYAVVRTAEPTGGISSALLVRRRAHDALSSDVYYVLIVDKDYRASTLAATVHSEPVLVATKAQGVLLEWLGPNDLAITCSKCGLNKIDVIERRTNWKSIRITYTGFPDGAV